jgi:transposase InsO family protein
VASEPTAQPDAYDDLTLRAIDAYSRRHRLDAVARRALLQAIQDLTLCFVASWNELRQNGTTAEKLFADLAQTRFQLAELRDWAEILAACRAEIDPRRRNHYTPSLRFRILEHMRQYMLSIEQTAQRFVVTGQTVRNWLADLDRNSGDTTIGKPLVSPEPPIRRFADGVRRLIQLMKQHGLGGKKKIAQTLMRIGWKADPSTVGRIMKEPLVPAPEPPPGPTRRRTTVRGDYPGHLILIDITRIPLLFPFLHLHLMVVLDAFSRLPLAACIRFLEPSAADAIALLQQAIHVHGKPRHLVMDQGPQFTAEVFKTFLKNHGIRFRYGKVGEAHSLGLIDRFFKTLKHSLGVPLRRPWDFRGMADFKHRLELALVHYSYVRPHTALDNLTPIEKHYGIRAHLPIPATPPRGRREDTSTKVPFDIVFLDPENQAFPIVVPKAA